MSMSILATTSNAMSSNSNNNNNNNDNNDESDLIADNNYAKDVHDWQVDDVLKWATESKRLNARMINCLKLEEIDGEVLLSLTESDVYDFRYRFNHQLTFSELKKLWLCVSNLQQQYYTTTPTETILLQTSTANKLVNKTAAIETDICSLYSNAHKIACQQLQSANRAKISTLTINDVIQLNDTNLNSCNRNCTSPCSRGSVKVIPPEYFKTLISIVYSFLVTWITSFVMVIVHERVPDMKRYPPLPDIFLDNVPHIPWAFHMCEITGTLLFAIWVCVIIFHRHRTVLLRRFFAMAGTVFLLRCVTMLITSLSVPGTHLQCDQTDLAVDDPQLSFSESLEIRIMRAYIIWSGLGMSIQGVRTCGDYMFSGHTVALTLLNFFITEYTPRNLYFLHTLTWLLNMFGIFFILAAHEHYSIDVFVAFYITSRLFLYYHTLANNQALMSQDSTRTRIWFPMFSYFESSVECIVPNEYDSIQSILSGFMKLVLDAKDVCMLTGRRIWLHPPQLAYIPRMQITARKIFNMPRVSVFTVKRMTNAATSTATLTNLKTPSTATINTSGNTSLLSSYWNFKNFSLKSNHSSLDSDMDKESSKKLS